MRRNNHHRELIALTLIPGLGKQRIKQLLNHFESAGDVFRAGVRQIRQVEGLGEAIANQIATFKQWKLVDDIMRKTKRAGARLVSYTCIEYPALLRQIYDSPSLLWVKGDVNILSDPGIAVVGTRSPDRYGREQAEIWSKKLLGQGLTVTSGLAYGVDTLAHRTALKYNGRTIAVLGSGIDWIYPERNGILARNIIKKGGAVISEFRPGTKPDAGNFPVRNRLVSGMSFGVLVIQSGVKGGSMITARSALDQNREVFVVPHNLNQEKGEGNNYLIRTGQGKLIQNTDDIINEISYQPSETKAEVIKDIPEWRTMNLPEFQKQICGYLANGSLHIDLLAEKSGKQAQDLLPELLELEIKEIVFQEAGKYFGLK